MIERPAWESALKQFGVDPDEDRAFLDKQWDERQRDVQDDTMDLGDLVELSRPICEGYLMGKAMGVPGRSVGRPGSGGDVSVSDVRVPFDAAGRARIKAFSEYLAKIASVHPYVMRFRRRSLGAPTRTLTSAEATAWLESYGGDSPPGRDGSVSLLWPDGGGSARIMRAAKDTPVGDLVALARWLSRQFPWSEDQGAYYVLCGGVPQAAAIKGKPGPLSWGKGTAAHKYDRAVITLEVESWVRAEYVSAAYRILQRHANDGRGSRRPKDRDVEIFRFVLQSSSVEVKSKQQDLARLQRPPWRELLAAWNEQLPEGHPWRYRADRVRHFQRDFMNAQMKITGTQWALTGVPGEPRTSEEVRQDLESMWE